MFWTQKIYPRTNLRILADRSLGNTALVDTQFLFILRLKGRYMSRKRLGTAALTVLLCVKIFFCIWSKFSHPIFASHFLRDFCHFLLPVALKLYGMEKGRNREDQKRSKSRKNCGSWKKLRARCDMRFQRAFQLHKITFSKYLRWFEPTKENACGKEPLLSSILKM